MDADTLLDDTETVYEQTVDHLRDGARLFHENEGELFTQPEAIELFETELELTDTVARKVLTQLVGDRVDPVIQVIDDETKYIGVVEFQTFDGAYGYVGYDPIYGTERRVVCQQCVDESPTDEDVTTVTGTELCGPSSDEVAWEDLTDALHDHYDGAHSNSPASVESSVAATGAELRSGTQIAGNPVVHDGRSGEVPIKAANANALQNQTPGGEGGIATSSEVDNKSISKKGIVTSLDDQTDLTLVNTNSTSVTDANGDLSDLSSPLQFKANDADKLQGYTPTGDNGIALVRETMDDSEAQAAVSGADLSSRPSVNGTNIAKSDELYGHSDARTAISGADLSSRPSVNGTNIAKSDELYADSDTHAAVKGTDYASANYPTINGHTPVNEGMDSDVDISVQRLKGKTPDGDTGIAKSSEIGTFGQFELSENSSTNSLDFNYTGQ